MYNILHGNVTDWRVVKKLRKQWDWNRFFKQQRKPKLNKMNSTEVNGKQEDTTQDSGNITGPDLLPETEVSGCGDSFAEIAD